MLNKRKNKRIDLEVKLILHKVTGGETEKYEIRVNDISREGIGFYSDSFLEVQEYYDTELLLEQEVIKTVIKILHCKREEGGFEYGAEFVGMSEQDKFRIDVYQIVHE